MAKARQHQGHGHIVSFIILIIVLAALAAVGYLAYNLLSQSAPQPQVVIVTGFVKTIGLTTYPTAVYFASGSSSASATVTRGRYALSLITNNFYNATVYYKSLAGFGSGTCYAGKIGITGNQTIFMENLTC
ncbi:MAG: hypothetical protein KGH71_01215 [Candidatus Micrarchaeota archaeon]|nr:hypothetical protein [Candidatus Micrarchaeota archaeon]